MKRILGLILALTVIISMSNVSVSADKAENLANRNFEILKYLGIVDWTQDGSVSKGEFVKIVADIVIGENVKTYESYKSPFADVDDNTKYRNEIIGAYSYGIVNGNGGYFNPNAKISYNEAIKILVVALGYNIHAESRGGYPGGYIAQANSLGIKGYDTSDMTRANCATILIDALNAPVAQVSHWEKDSFNYISGNGASLLYFTKGIYRIKGVVTDNGLTSLTTTKNQGKEFAEIENVIYKNEYDGIRELLGYQTYAYIKENKDGFDSLVYAYDFANKVFEISSDEFVSYKNKEITYATESGNVKSISISGSVPVIYNNKVLETYGEEDFKIENGKISLIDNGNETGYDVVRIDSYTDYFVLSATPDTFVVTDKHNQKRTVKFDFDDSDTEIIIQNKNGIHLDYSDINENTVLTVASSKDGKYINCYLSNDTAYGVVEGVKKSKYRTTVTVDDVSYSVSKSIDKDALAKIKTRTEGTFYLNVYGEIAGYIQDVRSNEFAYLIGTASIGDFDKTATFRLLLSNGDIVTVNAKNKYFVDGDKCENGAIPLSVQKQQVIRVKFNGNMEITHIDTIENPKTDDFDELDSFGAMEDRTYWSRGVCMGGIVVPDNIVIFSVPVPTDNCLDEREFETKKKSELAAGKHRMQFFNAKKDSYIPQVMVLENIGTPQISASANLGVVAGIEITTNIDGDPVEKLNILNSVGEHYYEVKNSEMVTTVGIETGDTIAYELNSKNQITAANVIVDYNSLNPKNSILRGDTDVANLTSPTRSYDATFRVRYGYAYAKEGNNLTISDKIENNIPKSQVESLIVSTSMIYKVEQNRGEVKTSLIKLSDIKDYLHFGSEAQKVLAFFQSTAPKMMVVYE